MKKTRIEWLAVGMTALALAGCANNYRNATTSGDPDVAGSAKNLDCVPTVEKVMPAPGIKSESDRE